MKNIIAALTMGGLVAGGLIVGAAALVIGAGIAHANVSPVFGADPKLDNKFERGACLMLNALPTQSQLRLILNQDVEMGLSEDYISHYLKAAETMCPQHKALLDLGVEVTR